MKPPVHAVRDLGHTIKRLRLQLKMTQQELADARVDLIFGTSAASKEDSAIRRLERYRARILKHFYRRLVRFN